MNATFILHAMTSSNPYRTGYRSSIMPLIYGPRSISTIGVLLASTTSSTVLVLSNLSSCYCLPEAFYTATYDMPSLSFTDRSPMRLRRPPTMNFQGAKPECSNQEQRHKKILFHPAGYDRASALS